MRDYISRLVNADSRLVAGIMSGTSLDGVDTVIARITGSGRGMSFDVLAFRFQSYSAALRADLMRQSTSDTSDVREISQLNVRLAHEYARAVDLLLEEDGMDRDELDLVGSHGQTIHHVPVPERCAGELVSSTLQIGDPSVLANLLGVPVVGDFRLADMAHGGQGAPLVPYFDYVFFCDDELTRGLLNLGGIANLTVLPAGGAAGEVTAFDTGPANILIDLVAEQLFERPYDENGELATAGTVDDNLLADLLTQDAYLSKPPPKSTGRELYGAPYARAIIDAGVERGLSSHDIIATTSALTAASIYQAYARFIRDRHTLGELIVSGGGRRNGFLMHRLQESFAPIHVRPIDAFGIDTDAKEALCFAVLAHETMSGVPTGMPSVTGAGESAILGKICIPARNTL